MRAPDAGAGRAPQAAPRLAQDGLVWGIRGSFLDYVSGSGGTIAVADGAGTVGEGAAFHFPVADASGFDVDTSRGVVAFAGAVRFTAHYGMLAVEIAQLEVDFGDDIQLSARGGDGVRRVLAVAAGSAPEAVEAEGARVLSWAGLATTLHPAATGVFNDVYPAGSDLDDLHIRVATSRLPASA